PRVSVTVCTLIVAVTVPSAPETRPPVAAATLKPAGNTTSTVPFAGQTFAFVKETVTFPFALATSEAGVALVAARAPGVTAEPAGKVSASLPFKGQRFAVVKLNVRFPVAPATSVPDTSLTPVSAPAVIV